VRICPSISASSVSMVRSFSEIAWRTDMTSTSESEEFKRVVYDGFCSFRAGCKSSIEVVVVVKSEYSIHPGCSICLAAASEANKHALTVHCFRLELNFDFLALP